MDARSIRTCTRAVLAFLVTLGLSTGALAAQEAGTRPLTIDDYSQWRSIEDESISGDGRWVVYTLRYTNVPSDDEEPLLVLRDLDSGEDVEVPHAHDGQFARDSRWLVYQVDSVPAPRRDRDEDEPAAEPGAPADESAQSARPPRIELRELGTGRTRSWDGVQSATFNHTSSHLLLRLRAASGGGRGGGGGDSSRGADYLLHDLSGGRSHFLGSVGEGSFSRQGDLLAYAVQGDAREANGLFVMHLGDDAVHVLDNDTLIYGRLEWSDDGERLAALKGHPVEDMRERDNTLIAFRDLRRSIDEGNAAPSVTLDEDAEGFPAADFVISERAQLSWSEDGRRVFFGVIPQRPEIDEDDEPSRDSVANVDIWRTGDERIQSVQMIQAEGDLNFTFQHAFDVTDRRFVALTDSTMRELEISPDGRWAVGIDDRAYVSDTAHARADLYRVDTSTGERTLMMAGQLVGQHDFGISPDGRRFLYWEDDRFQAYDFETERSHTLPGGEDGEFVDAEHDRVGPTPAYGVEGFASDGSGVIVQSRYDLWLLPYDGGAARNLTAGQGAAREIELRQVDVEPDDIDAPRRVRTGREIDLDRPVLLSAYGQWTKESGFYRLDGGRLEELVFEDARFGTPGRAEHADRMLLTQETYRDFPDLRVSGPAFDDLQTISNANPQQAEFVWGRTVLFDYENADGVRLQGVLALPDDYQEGERRPMIVSFYEKNSQNLHRYPSPRFMTGMGSLSVEALSRGYITMLADVHFRTGSSHSDMLESVEAATRKVIELGYADPDRIGVHGHSYGGEGAAFIGVRSTMFAAVGMGAGVTDIEADFNQSWGWSYQVAGGSGENGSDYYMHGQGRWGTSPFEDPELYRFESAITHAKDAVAPFLIMHGTADPTVDFSEGMNFYQALRFNGKEAIMLAYPEEGHGLRGLANRRDLTVRYFEFFDHYLRGEPAPKWMTEGVPYLVKQAGG